MKGWRTHHHSGIELRRKDDFEGNVDQLFYDIEVVITGRLHESTHNVTLVAVARCRVLLEEKRKAVQYGIERHRPRFVTRRCPRLFQVGHQSRKSFRFLFANFCVNRIWQPFCPYRCHS